MTTMENLQDAFAGESQANRKYTAFAKKAEQDGFKQVARLFRAAAEAETIHAHAHLRVMGGIKSTAENLAVARDGEGYEFQSMYPGFLAQAKTEGHAAAVKSFEFAMAAEKVHYGLYAKALELVKQGKDLENAVIYLCPVCGNVEIGVLPEKCSICGVPGSKFVEIK
ncbi:MAG: rubrerythrin family protein [Acidobacteria bacterium]|nr:rubrerythrin family protein [Acidobacteriota bacterium]